MNWIITNIKWIMVISGVLTSTMVYAALAPDAALQSNFGETVDAPLARMIVRNWGALIAMVGASSIRRRRPVKCCRRLRMPLAIVAKFMSMAASGEEAMC